MTYEPPMYDVGVEIENMKAALMEARAEIERLRGIIGDLLWDIGHDNDLNEATAKAKAALKDTKP